MKARVGDKVRLKLDHLAGARGVIERAEGKNLAIRLEASETTVQVAAHQITNLSCAARKAWLNMPKRHVGRPKGLRLCDRTSVTLRIDRDLWKQFREKESIGLVRNRTATINQWLREKLSELDQGGPQRLRNG
jgi:uncharacterized protein (DUF4415 family)